MEVKIKDISPLKFNLSTKDSSKYESQNRFYSYKDSPVQTQDINSSRISDKVNEAKDILEKAKESLKKMNKEEYEYEKKKRYRIEQEEFRNSCDIALLGCEMRQNVMTLEREIKELSKLTIELLQPGYYKRNKYPHEWRLTRNYIIKN